MGQAEAQDLSLDGGPLYDPLANYRRVAGSWNDWASDPRHPVGATRTVDPERASAGADVAPGRGPPGQVAPAGAPTGVTPPAQ